jgi:hypothetical protein
MKKLACVVVVGLVLVTEGSAQFKSQAQEPVNVADRLVPQTAPSLLLGWFNPENFSMRHSFSLSYATGPAGALSLGTYTNIMQYKFAENLDARADLSLSYSPYNSLSSYSPFARRNDLGAFYLSRAEINYRPWENTMVQFQYRTLPYGYYYSPFYSPWHREDGF